MAASVSSLAHASVLVTGADGFVGSHLCEALVAAGARVTAGVRPTSVTGTDGFRLRNLGQVQDRLHQIVALDVAGPEAADTVFDLAPELIFHLAAEAYVPRSFTMPRTVVHTNVMGTANVLEGARRLPQLRRVVVASSSEVYGTARTEAITEDHCLEPTSPYAASKLAADRLVLSYHRTYDLPATVLRPFNTYGPRHVYDVIPRFISRALAGEPLTVHGDGRQRRDFTYIDDMVDAYLRVATVDGLSGRALNAGTGEDVSIAELAALIVELADSSSDIVHDQTRPAEVARLRCDARALRELTGWGPTVGLRDGLARNLAWAREDA